MAGIQDSKVIDLVTHDPRTDQATLIIVQTMPWHDGPTQADELRKKLDTYVAFAREGLAEKYPQMAGKRVRIQVDCQVAPSAATIELLELAGARLRDQGFDFAVNVLS